MLDLAAKVMGPNAHRADLVEGIIDDAPMGPFDGATCLLTLHFLDREERIRTAAEIRARLKSGAPFVHAHGSLPQGPGVRDRRPDRDPDSDWKFVLVAQSVSVRVDSVGLLDHIKKH